MESFFRSLVFLMFVTILSACARDEVTQEQSVMISNILLDVANTSNGKLSQDMLAYASQGNNGLIHGDWIEGSPENFTISGKLDDPDGDGYAKITGTGRSDETSWDYSIKITFVDWVEKGLTLEGTLEDKRAAKVGPEAHKPIQEASALMKGPLDVMSNSNEERAFATVLIRTKLNALGTSICGTISEHPIEDGKCF